MENPMTLGWFSRTKYDDSFDFDDGMVSFCVYDKPNEEYAVITAVAPHDAVLEHNEDTMSQGEVRDCVLSKSSSLTTFDNLDQEKLQRACDSVGVSIEDLRNKIVVCKNGSYCKKGFKKSIDFNSLDSNHHTNKWFIMDKLMNDYIEPKKGR